MSGLRTSGAKRVIAKLNYGEALVRAKLINTRPAHFPSDAMFSARWSTTPTVDGHFRR